MGYLPLECILQIAQRVDSVEDLCNIMHVNRALFFAAARCLWYDPFHTVTKTRQPNVSLLRLVRLIYAISPSEDEEVQLVRQFLEWAVTGNDPTGYLDCRDAHGYVFREPFTRTVEPLLGYLSFIGTFDVSVHQTFHRVVDSLICVPLELWLRTHRSNEVKDDNHEGLDFDERYSNTVDILECSLITAACGHRLSRLRRISIPFRHLDRYLEVASTVVSAPSKLMNVEEMVWDMIPRRTYILRQYTRFDPTVMNQVLERIHQCREYFHQFHTVELMEKNTVFDDEDELLVDKFLYKHLPPLPSPKRLSKENMVRVFAQWKGTDLRHVVEFKFTNADFNTPNKEVRQWATLDDDEATRFHDQAGNKRGGCQGSALQRLRSLRNLEFEAGDDSVFDWAVKEKFRKDRGEAVQLVPLRAITVYCQLDHVERIANDAAVAFGETLEKLDIRVDEASNPPESFDASKTATKIIRIGHGWRLPRLSYLALDGTKEALLDIDPTFLGHTTCLTHLELVDGCLEEDAPEDDEIRMPTLHASRMQRLRLIGTACWLFDPASLVSMCDSLKYLELRNQGCVSTTGPDCKHWRWQEWSFPQLHQLSLEGSVVAGFPWHKMTEYPQLQSVYFGAGPYLRKVAPWLEDVVEAALDATSNIQDHVEEIGSHVEHLELKGAWQLPISTLKTLVQDICPKLNTLLLEQCKGHTGEDLYQVLIDHQRPLCINTRQRMDFASENLVLDDGRLFIRPDDPVENEDYEPRIIFRGERYLLASKLRTDDPFKE